MSLNTENNAWEDIKFNYQKNLLGAYCHLYGALCVYKLHLLIKCYIMKVIA